jgi:hypothetical protein
MAREARRDGCVGIAAAQHRHKDSRVKQLENPRVNEADPYFKRREGEGSDPSGCSNGCSTYARIKAETGSNVGLRKGESDCGVREGVKREDG